MPPKTKLVAKRATTGNKKVLVSMLERHHGRCVDCTMWHQFKYLVGQVCMNCRNATALQTRGITIVAMQCDNCAKVVSGEEGKLSCVICVDRGNESSSSDSSSVDMSYKSSSSDEDVW